MAMKKPMKKRGKGSGDEAFVYSVKSMKANSPSASTRTKSSANRSMKEDAKSNTTYPPSSSHKQLAPRPKPGSKAALLPYQGPKRNSKAK